MSLLLVGEHQRGGHVGFRKEVVECHVIAKLQEVHENGEVLSGGCAHPILQGNPAVTEVHLGDEGRLAAVKVTAEYPQELPTKQHH